MVSNGLTESEMDADEQAGSPGNDLLNVGESAGAPGSAGPFYICDRCGTRMYERQCKIICPNCGSQYDCSDLTIYFD